MKRLSRYRVPAAIATALFLGVGHLEGAPALDNPSSSKLKIYAPEVESITINGMTIPVGKKQQIQVPGKTAGTVVRSQPDTGAVPHAVPPVSAAPKTPHTVVVPHPVAVPHTAPHSVAGSQAVPHTVAVPQTGPVQAAQPLRAAICDLRGRALTVPISGYAPKLMRGSFYQSRGGRIHAAVDILAPRNTPVLAVEAGTVGRLFTSKAGGLTVYQKSHDGKFVYYYAHLERYADNLQEGAPIARNQVIGYVGTSGNAPPNTPHLHFAISKTDGTSVFHGIPIDPFEVYNNQLSTN